MFSHHRYGTWLVGATLSCSSLFTAASATAAPLACMQRAIDWRAADVHHNFVTLAFTALHESGEAAYASGTLETSTCIQIPYYTTQVSCLVTLPGHDVNALLLHPFTTVNPNNTLRVGVDAIPSDNHAQVRLHQPNATYDFDPRCDGNQLIGDDQWGNHWTLSFALGRSLFPF